MLTRNLLTFTISKGGILVWAVHPPLAYWFGSITISGKEYTHGVYRCLAIGYFGYWERYMEDFVIPHPAFRLKGFALLIFLTKLL